MHTLAYEYGAVWQAIAFRHTPPYDGRVSPPAKPRLSREDWEQAALAAIAADGLAAVAVEPLAARLGVTKGSFYAHFASRDELVDAALARWERSHGASLDELRSIADPRARLREAWRYAITFAGSHRPSVHVRLLGEHRDPRVREALQRVSRQRIARLEATFRELGFTPAVAGRRARLAYATYIGLLQLAQESPDETPTQREIAATLRESDAMLLAPPGGVSADRATQPAHRRARAV